MNITNKQSLENAPLPVHVYMAPYSKAERIRRWMSRQGLEGERKWMDDDTLREDGRVLVSPFVQDTSHGRSL